MILTRHRCSDWFLFWRRSLLLLLFLHLFFTFRFAFIKVVIGLGTSRHILVMLLLLSEGIDLVLLSLTLQTQDALRKVSHLKFVQILHLYLLPQERIKFLHYTINL